MKQLYKPEMLNLKLVNEVKRLVSEIEKHKNDQALVEILNEELKIVELYYMRIDMDAELCEYDWHNQDLRK